MFEVMQGFLVMSVSKSPYGNLFPAAIDTTLLSWVFMIGVPLALLFLVLDKWQMQAVPVPIKQHQSMEIPPSSRQ